MVVSKIKHKIMLEQFDFSKIEDQKKFEKFPKQEKEKNVDDAHKEALGIKEFATELVRRKGKSLVLAQDYENAIDSIGWIDYGFDAYEETEAENKINELTEELPPEIIDSIMDKVQDLNRKGVIYTNLRSHINSHNNSNKSYDTKTEFRKTMQEGLLGKNFIDRGEVTKELWAKHVRDKEWKGQWRGAGIWFNIVGRVAPNFIDDQLLEYDTKKDIVRSPLTIFKTGESYGNGLPTLIFELPNSKEVNEINEFGWRNESGYNNYRVMEERKVNKYGVNNKNEELVDPSHGFVLTGRVAPRFFKGLIVENSAYSCYPFLVNMAEVNKNNPKNLFPVYNEFGDLLWPKKLSYEEVKKQIAEKEQIKKEHTEK